MTQVLCLSRSVAAFGMAAAACWPMAAQAQFTLVSQQAQVEAHAYTDPSVSATSPIGATTSQSLFVEAGNWDMALANASAQTWAESGKVGVEAFVGGSGFNSTFSWSCGSYYECQNASEYAPRVGSSASASLYFDVSASTDASVRVHSAYRTSGPYVAGGFSFPLQFQRQDASGAWTSVGAPTDVSVLSGNVIDTTVVGMLHLDAGRYRMLADFSNEMVFNMYSTMPSPVSFGGASIAITAVPEPAAWAFMGLGLVGLGLVSRKANRLA